MTSTAHSSLCPSLINAFPPPPPTTSATGHWIRVRDPKGHKFARTVMRDGEIQFYVPFEMPPGGLKSLRLPPGIDIIDNGPFKKTQTPSYASGSRTLPSRFHERSRAPRPEPFSRVSPSNPPNGSWYTKPTTQTQRPSPTPAPIPSTTTLPKKPTKELPTRKSKPLANLSKPSKPRASKVSRKSNRIPVRYRGEEEVAPQRISFARTDMTTASVYSQDSWVEPTREPVPAIPTTFKKRLSASRQYNTAPIRRKRRSSRGEKRRSFQAPHLSEESDSTADEHGRAYAKLEGKPYTPSKNTQQTDPSPAIVYQYPKDSRHPHDKPVSTLRRVARFIARGFRPSKQEPAVLGSPNREKWLPRPPPEVYPQVPPPDTLASIQEVRRYANAYWKIKALDRTAA